VNRASDEDDAEAGRDAIAAAIAPHSGKREGVRGGAAGAAVEVTRPS
jgi:hypothetical protein